MIIEFIIPEMLMPAGAFRRDRSADSIQTLNDVTWLMFLGVVSTFIIQLAVIGIAILGDRRARPVTVGSVPGTSTSWANSSAICSMVSRPRGLDQRPAWATMPTIADSNSRSPADLAKIVYWAV